MKDMTVLERMHAQSPDHDQEQLAAAALRAFNEDRSCRTEGRQELTIFCIHHTVTAKT